MHISTYCTWKIIIASPEAKRHLCVTLWKTPDYTQNRASALPINYLTAVCHIRKVFVSFFPMQCFCFAPVTVQKQIAFPLITLTLNSLHNFDKMHGRASHDKGIVLSNRLINSSMQQTLMQYPSTSKTRMLLDHTVTLLTDIFLFFNVYPMLHQGMRNNDVIKALNRQ